MTPGRAAFVAAVLVTCFAVSWAIIARVRRAARPAAVTSATSSSQPPAPAGRKITATLYYVSEDGMTLVGVQREVPFGEPVVEQARRIIEAQLGAAPAPLAPAVPDGTTLRALFLSDRGDAFVDVSSQATTRHSGGALDELFTIYALVDALTVNLPAITRVQILVDGKEVDTLAGHVDLRHPLQKNLKWVAGTETQPAERNQ